MQVMECPVMLMKSTFNNYLLTIYILLLSKIVWTGEKKKVIGKQWSGLGQWAVNFESERLSVGGTAYF